MTSILDPFEAAARLFEPHTQDNTRKWATPGLLAKQIDPRTVQTPALDLIDAELVNVTDEPDGRFLLQMPPQEGKSQRVSRWYPLWVLTQKPDTRIAIVSYEHGAARRWGRAIRDEIIMHPELGLTVRDDLSAQHEWQLRGRDGGVYTAGIGGALTGRPVDLMIIDDPVKDREQADSPVYRQRAWDWLTDVGLTRLAPGAPVIVVQTRWHEKDLTGMILEAEDAHLWRRLNIPAQADHDPAKGETDPLGRAVGEFMESARGRTQRQWEAIKVRSGARTWASLYQGRPSPVAGDILKREWWKYYSNPQHIVREDGAHVVLNADEVIMSWDMAFKGTEESDFVVGQVWMRRGARAYLLDQVRGHWNFVETCSRLRMFSAKWPQALLKLVEDKANGTAVLAALQLTVPGMVPEEPHGSKEARAHAVSPLIEAGNVLLPAPELAPWVEGFVEEASMFPNGSHDDQVDTATQALNRLILQPFIDGTDLITDDDLDDDLAEYTIAPY